MSGCSRWYLTDQGSCSEAQMREQETGGGGERSRGSLIEPREIVVRYPSAGLHGR
jgi:hypothetical protein